jgi:hypothetical protein
MKLIEIIKKWQEIKHIYPGMTVMQFILRRQLEECKLQIAMTPKCEIEVRWAIDSLKVPTMDPNKMNP